MRSKTPACSAITGGHGGPPLQNAIGRIGRSGPPCPPCAHAGRSAVVARHATHRFPAHSAFGRTGPWPTLPASRVHGFAVIALRAMRDVPSPRWPPSESPWLRHGSTSCWRGSLAHAGRFATSRLRRDRPSGDARCPQPILPLAEQVPTTYTPGRLLSPSAFEQPEVLPRLRRSAARPDQDRQADRHRALSSVRPA